MRKPAAAAASASPGSIGDRDPVARRPLRLGPLGDRLGAAEVRPQLEQRGRRDGGLPRPQFPDLHGR